RRPQNQEVFRTLQVFWASQKAEKLNKDALHTLFRALDASRYMNRAHEFPIAMHCNAENCVKNASFLEQNIAQLEFWDRPIEK
ncbi:hypothetical protein AD951_02585, partial [Acetobacter malorum]